MFGCRTAGPRTGLSERLTFLTLLLLEVGTRVAAFGVMTAIDKDLPWPFAVAIPSKRVDAPILGNMVARPGLETQFTFQTEIEHDNMQLRHSMVFFPAAR